MATQREETDTILAPHNETSERDKDLCPREEEKTGKILAEVTDGFLLAEV